MIRIVRILIAIIVIARMSPIVTIIVAVVEDK